ncbi:MAG TPA: hypothetical protein VGI91_07975 [Steroidobacteraceae bacterium]|jgi:hypothetical protein
MKSPSMPGAALLGIGLLLCGCAKISAPNLDYAGPTPSLDVKATAVNALFSHFTGELAVSAIALQHQGPAAPATASVTAGSSAGSSTVRLSAAPTFSVGDIVTVTWSGAAKTLVGSSYLITQQATYRILTAALKVQTPWGGLGPGASGKVCVALEPNAPSAVSVTLDSSAVAVAPTTLSIAAGQPKASSAATATMEGFSCPAAPASGTAAGPAQPLPCDSRNGVLATATLGGLAIHGCGPTGQSCCGVGGHSCSAPPPPPSLCP